MASHSAPAYTLSLMAPYPQMGQAFAKMATGMHCRCTIWEGFALDDAVNVAKDAYVDESFEVIVSRGGTAAYLQSSFDTPVVSITTTALDLFRTLQPYVGKVRRVAFFHYDTPMPEVQTVATALGCIIDEYLFTTRENLILQMLEAKARGAELGVGGVLIAQMRDVCGLEGVLLEAGDAAIQRALGEALSIARLRRAEQGSQARFQTIINTIAEGLLVTDENNILTHANDTVARLLGVVAADILGKDVRAVVPNTQMPRVLETGRAEYNEIQSLGLVTVITSRVPITVEGRTRGVISTFSEADKIQKAEQALRKQRQEKGFKARYCFDDILTQDVGMRELLHMATLFATTSATILLHGESGTGKELFAQGIHTASLRQNAPFVAVNCAAIPESLLESELFGYAEGAFTGARRQGKAGFFEFAHGGTLFLDEISELPAHVQTRLLRVIQEQEIMRVGGEQVMPVDVRIVCATNRNLPDEVARGTFREDLYYRINVLPLSIPPLRARGEDSLLLASHCLHKKLYPSQPHEKIEQMVRRYLADKLLAHSWPGNVRELLNVMERFALAVSLFREKTWSELFQQVWQHDTVLSHESALPRQQPGEEHLMEKVESLKAMTRAFERQVIRQALAVHNNDQGKVAKHLGISRMSLWRKLHGGPCSARGSE